jgi:hypothetical protein
MPQSGALDGTLCGWRIRTLPAVRGRFNAAELDSVQVTSFAGLHFARVTVNARQIQRQASLN